MKCRTTIMFLLMFGLSFAQIPVKKDIQQGRYIGQKAFEAIQSLNYKLINSYVKDTTNLSFLLKGFESKRFHKDSISIITDILYNQDTKNYEFIVYGGNYISTKDDWGLFDYHFVIKIEIDLKNADIVSQIIKTTVLKEQDALKKWWQYYMRSYNSPKFSRKEIAKKYRLIPPPPPPPATKEWFK